MKYKLRKGKQLTKEDLINTKWKNLSKVQQDSLELEMKKLFQIGELCLTIINSEIGLTYAYSYSHSIENIFKIMNFDDWFEEDKFDLVELAIKNIDNMHIPDFTEKKIFDVNMVIDKNAKNPYMIGENDKKIEFENLGADFASIQPSNEMKGILVDPKIFEATRQRTCKCGEPIRLTSIISGKCPKCKKEYDFPETDDHCECCGASDNPEEGSFMWAVEQKNMRRKTQANKSFRIYWSGTQYHYITDSMKYGSPYYFSKSDFKATDWEIFEEKSAIQKRIDSVSETIKTLDSGHGSFVVDEAIKQARELQ